MMNNKKFLEKAVVLGLLLASPNIAGATEGVDEPFNSAAALAAVNGTATITGSNQNNSFQGVIGIYYVSGSGFVYGDPINLTINGFTDANNHNATATGLWLTSGVSDLKKINLTMIDNTAIDHRVYGLQTFAGATVKLGDASKITVSGNSSESIYGMYAGNNSYGGPGTILGGNDLEINITNKGTGYAYGILAGDSASAAVGDNLKVTVNAKDEARGVEAGRNGAHMNIGKNANISVHSTDAASLGAFATLTGKIEFGSGLTINSSTDSSSKWAMGILVKDAGSEAVLNGATILTNAGSDNENGYAFYLYDGGKITGNAGKYNIVGNILNVFGGQVDLSMNSASYMHGKIETDNSARTDLSLTENSVWEVTDHSYLNHLVNDHSTIDMTQDNGKFTGLMVENLSGNDGVIKMHVDTSLSANNSDKLYITDTLTGTQYIDLYDVNSHTPIGAEGVGTVLATVNNHNGSFAAVDGEGTLYWNRYELDKQDTADLSGSYTKDWYLKQVVKINVPTTSIQTVMSANALNYHTWRNENDKLLQRMGELRLNGEDAQGVWFRIRGAKIGRDGSFDFENKYTAYELGYDAVTKQTADKTRYQGVAFSYTDGDSSYTRGSGDNSSKAISFYNTEIGSKGHYLDMILKIGTMDNDFTVYDTRSNKITGDFNNTGISLSAEYGRKNALEHGWYFEPQAQFTLGYLGGDDYSTSNGINIDQSGIKSAVGRIGFNIGREIGTKGIVYAKANLLHEFGGGYNVTMNDGTDSLKVSDTFNDTWFEYGVGAAFKTSDNSHIYLDVERSAGSDFTKNWQWNIGARWTF